MAVTTNRTGLNQETRTLLEYIRKASPANRVCGSPVQVVKAQAHAVLDRVVNSCGLDHSVVDELRWFMEDVAQALCFGQGELLAFELDGVMHKWLSYSLEPNTVQLLLRVLLHELAGIVVPAEPAKAEATSQKPDARTAA